MASFSRVRKGLLGYFLPGNRSRIYSVDLQVHFWLRDVVRCISAFVLVEQEPFSLVNASDIDKLRRLPSGPSLTSRLIFEEFPASMNTLTKAVKDRDGRLPRETGISDRLSILEADRT